MKSHELAALLLSKPDVELIMQKDSEGNGYSPLEGVDFGVVYVPDSTRSGDCYSTECSADDNCMSEDEWEELKKSNSGYAVLYPVN
jgi:hypothetical protein